MGKRNAAAAIVDVDRLQQFDTPPKRMKHAAAHQAAPAAPAQSADDSASEFTLSKEFVDGTKLMDLTLKQWRIGKPIGKGSFGEIFLASDDIDTPVTSENAMYVVKIEPHSNGPLFVEIHCLLNTAKRSETYHIPPGMPEYIASGSHMFKNERYRFLILKRYERDLHSLIKNKRVNPKCIPVVACQILDVMEHLHDQGYVHSDIKAENLMIGKVPQGSSGGGGSLTNGQNGTTVGPQRSGVNGTVLIERVKGGRRSRKGGLSEVMATDLGGHLVENGLYQHQEQEMGGRARNLRPLKTVTYRDLSDEEDRSRGGSSAGGGGGVGGGPGGVGNGRSDRAPHRRRGRKKNNDALFSCSISPRRSGYDELRAATEEAHWNELHQHKHLLRASATDVGVATEQKPTMPLEDRIHLIDFGLASKFMDSSGQHRPFCMDQRRAHDGTLEFTSRDAHMGAHARRSDLECLGYNLVYWSRGFLPWKDEKLLNQPEQVHRMKEYFMTDVREMLRLVYGDDCPAYLGDFLAYVGQLTYDERPDYQYCRSLFHKELKRLGCPVGRNQPLRLDVNAIERLSEPLTSKDEADITNKINHVKSLMKLGGALFPYRESTLHSKASSPKNLRSKRRDAANGRNSLAAADGGAQTAGGGPMVTPVTPNVVGTRKREKKISCEEIFATDADQIARERVEKEYERAEQMEETVIRYTGRPTYAIQELERKMRTGGGGHNGWCSGGGGGSGGLEYTESEDYIKGYTKPMMDILRKRQSQLFREIEAANAAANRNKEESSPPAPPAVKVEHHSQQYDEQAATQEQESDSDDSEAEEEHEDEEQEQQIVAPAMEQKHAGLQDEEDDEEDDEEMEKRLRREKYYHDTDYEAQEDEEEEDEEELSVVEEEEDEDDEEEEEEEEDEEEDEEDEEDDQYEEEEDKAPVVVVVHNGHVSRKRQHGSAKNRLQKKQVEWTVKKHDRIKQVEDTDSDFFNDGGCDEEEEQEEEEVEGEEDDNEEQENEEEEVADGEANEDALAAGDVEGTREHGDEEDEEDEDQQDSDFNDQESSTSGSDVISPKRRRIVSTSNIRRGKGKKSSANGRKLKAKVKGARVDKKSKASNKTMQTVHHGKADDETVVNGFSVERCFGTTINRASERRHSKKKHHQKRRNVHPAEVDEEDDGDNARHNGTPAVAVVAPVMVVRQNHHHNNNNHCNSKAYYGDVDDSSHDMAPPANSVGDGQTGSSGESKYRLVKRRKSGLRERIRPTDRGNDYNQQRKQKADQRNKRRSETNAHHLSAGLQDSRLESTLHDDEEASCSSRSSIVSSVSNGSGGSSSSSSRSTTGSTSSRGRTGSVRSSVVSEEAVFSLASSRENDIQADSITQKRKRGRPRKVSSTAAAETVTAAQPSADAFDVNDSSNSSSTRRRHRGESSFTTGSKFRRQDEPIAEPSSDVSQPRWSRANSSHSNRSAATSRSSSVSASSNGSGTGGGGASTLEYGSRERLPTLPEDDDFIDEDDDDTRDVDYSPVCTRRKRKALTTTTSTSGTSGNGISRRTTTTSAAHVRKRNDFSKGGNGRRTGPATVTSSASSAASVADSRVTINHAIQSGSGRSAVVTAARRPDPEPSHQQAPAVVAIQPNRGRRYAQHQNYYHPIEEPIAPHHPHHHHHHQHLQHHHPPTMLVRTYSRG